MPHSAPVVLSRRRFVAAAAGVTGLAVAGGCALPAAVDQPDPLIALIDAAARDARELSAADVTHGPRIDALRRIADARRVHADALAELADLPERGGQPGTVEPPSVCPPVDEVRARLRSDAARAADVAVEIDGARSEIAGAVSAACTAAAEVVLA